MILTKEEKIDVVKMVLESYKGITLTEAKSNNEIREVIKKNLIFYSGIKESLGPLMEGGGIWGTILKGLGTVKDFLTGTTVVKKFTDFISKIYQKIKEWVKEKANSFADKYLGPKTKDILSMGADAMGESIKGLASVIKGIIKWLSDTLSYKGIAKLLARIKHWTFSPSQDQIDCMLPLAKKILSALYVILVTAFVIKMIMIFAPVLAAATPAKIAAFGSHWTSYIVPIFAKVSGGKGAFAAVKGLGSTASAGVKLGDADKYADQAEAALEKTGDKEDSWAQLWDNCSGKDIKALDSNQTYANFAIKLNKSIKGFGTDEKLLFSALEKLTQKDDNFKEKVTKYYKTLYKNDLEADIKGDLSGDELKQALSMLKENKFYKPMNPYTDENTTRTFSKDVDPMSLIWHTDQEDRTVTVLEGKGWQFQRDNELPLALTEGVHIFIPKGQIHRIIKGQTDLKLKIKK